MAAYIDIGMIIDFLRGIGGDHLGREYEDHLSVDSQEMERCHDRIQWFFPLHEASKMARNFPIITPEIVKESEKYPEIKKNLLKALDIMRVFYAVGKSADMFVFPKLVHDLWCKNGDHNLLRITRIIRSLRLFGLNKEANEFYDEVLQVAKERNISETTLDYWKIAKDGAIWEPIQK
jgi:hypothetical protein